MSPRQGAVLDMPSPPWVVGHRGAAGCSLENTVEAVRAGVEAGADLVEVDVRLAADGELVVFHDATLERLGGRPGEVESLSSEVLVGLPLTDPSTGRRGCLPAFGEVLRALPGALPLNVELKRTTAPREALAEAVVGTVGGRLQVLISSFDIELLAAVRKLAPSLPLAPIARRDGPALLEAARRLEAWSVHCHRALADARLVAAAGAAQRPLLAYTVNEPQEAVALWKTGVAGIFSDRPDLLAGVRRKVAWQEEPG